MDKKKVAWLLLYVLPGVALSLWAYSAAFRTRTARPNSIVMVKWDGIRHNVPLDDARFEKASAP